MGPTSARTALLAAGGQTVIAVINYFVAASAVRATSAWTVATLRAFGTVLVLVPILAWMFRRGGYPRPPLRAFPAMLGLALLGAALNPWCFVTGLGLTNPARAALIYGLTPLVVMLWGIALRRERPGPIRWLGVVVALIGVVLVLSDRGGLEQGSARGDAILLLGTLFWAGYTALGKPIVEAYGAIPVTAWVLFLGFGSFLPVGLSTLDWAPLHTVGGAFWGSMAYMVLCNTILAYGLWYVAIRGLPPSRVAIFNNLQPVSTVLLSWLLFALPMRASMFVGVVCTVLGVLITQWFAGRDRARVPVVARMGDSGARD